MSNIIIQSRGILSVLAISALLSACGGGGGGGGTSPTTKASSVANSLVPTPNPTSSSRQAISSVSSLIASSRAELSSSSSAIIVTSSLGVSSSLSSTISNSAVSSTSVAVTTSSFSSTSRSSIIAPSSSSRISSSISSTTSSSSAITLVPAQPKNLTSSRQIGIGVSLTWVDEASNETAYVVKRAAAETPDTWVTLSDSLPANTVSYTDTSVNTAEAKAYVYQIRAAIGQSLSQPLNSAAINLLGYQHPKSGSLAPAAPATWGNANWKLGARFNNSDLEIAVYSKNAERILLEIYPNKHLAAAENNLKAAQARQDYWLVKGPDNIWRGKLTNVPENTLYAFRTWGPNWKWDEGWHRGNSKVGFISDVSRNGPAESASSYTGHRFNPNKVLADPYALEYSHDTGNPELLAANENDGIFGTGGADLVPLVAGSKADNFQYKGAITANVALDRRNIDTGIWAPKGVALRITPYTAAKPNVAQQDGIQMETHLRGLTKHPSTGQLRSLLTNYQQWFDNFDDVKDIPEELRGTYKGAGMMAPYLKALGVNVIEFLPIHETRNDPNDLNPTEANFWGYMSNGFFAPDRFYSSDKTPGGPTREFREMVEAFNKYGIEVWMDVVYNHTGEGGNWGNPFVTGFNIFGGFDTVEYYHLNPFDKRFLESGATGTGNQLNFSRDVNHNLVLDSLNYWADNMGISGFRFDLVTVLGREPDLHEGKPASEYWSAVKNFNSNHRTLIGIRELGASKNVKVTAEAWDNWGYAVGKFPNGWAEWNGRFRDSTRKFLKGDPSGDNGITVNDAFNGDYANFNDNGGPHKSVNFLVAHDGLTLADLVSYNSDKTRNGKLPAPFGPSNGGTDNNESWDSTGTAKPADLTTDQFRRQRLKNFWVFQFFSRGTPMIVYGDEFARTQNGNNNPYSIDSPATWNNYAMLASNAPQTVAVHPDYPTAKYDNNLGTASNTNTSVNPMLIFSRELMQRRKGDPALRQTNYNMPIHYTSETGGLMAGDARARRIHIEGSKAGGSDYVLFVNMWVEKLNFTYPAAPAGKTWKSIIDTAHWAEKNNFNIWKDSEAKPADAAVYGVNPWSIAVFKAL